MMDVEKKENSSDELETRSLVPKLYLLDDSETSEETMVSILENAFKAVAKENKHVIKKVMKMRGL